MAIVQWSPDLALERYLYKRKIVFEGKRTYFPDQVQQGFGRRIPRHILDVPEKLIQVHDRAVGFNVLVNAVTEQHQLGGPINRDGCRRIRGRREEPYRRSGSL